MIVTISNADKSETFDLSNDSQFKRYVHILTGEEDL
jgi:hypothetical protein